MPPGKIVELGKPLDDGRIMCTACARYCKIREGQIGFCGVRGVEDGQLWLYVYGRIISGHVDPIEKKPIIHYMPGTKIFSIATTGCNWGCKFCQNYDISQRRKVEGTLAQPEDVVRMTLSRGCQGLAYTYNQPSIFIEFARDIGVIARENGLVNIFVSNGWDTPDTVRLMGDFLDAITVDFKGSGEREFMRKVSLVPDTQAIYDTILEMRDKTDVHIEITDLIIPGYGDDLDAARHLSRFIHDELGPDVPIHFLRAHPDYKLTDFRRTPVKTLEAHCRVAKEEGLRYVYVGNVPGHELEHTYCWGCGEIAVRRHGFDITGWNLDENNRCKQCGHQLPIVGPLADTYRDRRFEYVV